MRHGTITALLVGLLLLCGGASYAASPQTVNTIAALRAGTFTSYPVVQVRGYHAPSDGGGGTYNLNGTSCSDNGGTIIKDAANNCFYRSGGLYTLEIFGAYGDAVISGTGVANSTTTFTDANVNFYTAYQAGKNSIAIIPPIGTTNAPKSTTFTASSGTPHTATLASGLAWTKSGVAYWFGHDDTTAFTNAVAALGASNFLTVGPSHYLMATATSGFAVGTTQANGFGIRGAGGYNSQLIIAGVGGSANNLTIGSAYTQGGVFQDFMVECAFSGQDCVSLNGSNTVFKNIWSQNSARDCYTISGTTAVLSFQNNSLNTMGAQNCGRHALDVNPIFPSYVNTSSLVNLNIHGVGERNAGSSGIVFEPTSTGQIQGLHFDVAEFDAQYGAATQNTYKPYKCPIVLNANVTALSFDQMQPENTGNGTIDPGGLVCSIYNAANPDLGVTTANITQSNSDARGTWGTGVFANPVSYYGVFFSIANGTVTPLFTTAANGNVSGILSLNCAGAAGNGGGDIYAINLFGGGTSKAAVSLSSGQSTLGIGNTFTITSAVVDTNFTTLKMTNTSGVTQPFCIAQFISPTGGINNFNTN